MERMVSGEAGTPSEREGEGHVGISLHFEGLLSDFGAAAGFNRQSHYPHAASHVVLGTPAGAFWHAPLTHLYESATHDSWHSCLVIVPPNTVTVHMLESHLYFSGGYGTGRLQEGLSTMSAHTDGCDHVMW